MQKKKAHSLAIVSVLNGNKKLVRMASYRVQLKLMYSLDLCDR
jgi:hypothetical protein